MYQTTLLYVCDSEVIQMDFTHNRLLLSSRKYCYLIDFDIQKSFKVC